MSSDDDGDLLIDPNAYLAYFPTTPLYLPSLPMTHAVGRAEEALAVLRQGRAAGWQSALADRYRNELEDLAWQVARVRETICDAERAYLHLASVARTNGE